MSEQDIRQAVLLIKAGRKAEAQKLLKTILESDLHNIHAWVWYVETLPTLQQKIRALEMCSRYNPDNERVIQGLQVLKDYQAQSREISDHAVESATGPTKVCGHCGETLQEWADVCSHCGSSLKSGFALPSIDLPSQFRSFRRPSMQSILRSLSFFRGFADIRSWAVVILFVFPAVGLCLIGYLLVQDQSESPNQNKLAIGESAKVTSVSLLFQPPMEFDSMTKQQVLDLRSAEVYRHPELVFSGYEPYEGVFGQIVDGLPWWGIAGQFYYGQGEQSIEGPSEESRFILNPYLLVAAERCGMWAKDKVSESIIRRPGFPFYCPPRNLKWEPENSYAEVTYDAACVAEQNFSCFNLIAYNARDLNLGYLYVSYERSQNITKTNQPAAAYLVPQYIHQGNSCGYPGGCNNMSPATPEIDGLSVVGLPASAEIWLWQEEPASLEVPPDMTFVIRIR